MAKKICEQPSRFEEINQRLHEISSEVYGEKLEIRFVDPASLTLLDKNARFMKHETFSRLVENIMSDGQLESVPLCHQTKDGKLEVISGNHRVKSAIKAGIQIILIMVILVDLSLSRKRAKQLAHNEIVGEDDLSILKEIWTEINTIEDKMYSGLDSIKIGELDKIHFSALSTPNIRTESITVWFLPEEIEQVEELVTYAENFIASKKIFLAPIQIYEHVFDMLIEVKKKHDIKNNAVALMYIFEVARNAIEQIRENEEKLKNETFK